ncbi:MAG: hypothetical protein WBV90_08420, partial [Terrimicrobiaceae bacterium]
PFTVPDSLAPAGIQVVAATAVFGGMHGQHAFRGASLLEEREDIGGEPIVRVDDVKLARQGACGEEAVFERTAHVPGLAHEVAVVFKRAAVEEDALAALVSLLSLGLAREEVDFMTQIRQDAGQFRNVDASAAHVN